MKVAKHIQHCAISFAKALLNAETMCLLGLYQAQPASETENYLGLTVTLQTWLRTRQKHADTQACFVFWLWVHKLCQTTCKAYKGLQCM